MVRRLSKEIGIRFSYHALRKGFCVYNVKTELSTRVVQALSGWEQVSMVERCSKSLTFDDALKYELISLTNSLANLPSLDMSVTMKLDSPSCIMLKVVNHSFNIKKDDTPQPLH